MRVRWSAWWCVGALVLAIAGCEKESPSPGEGGTGGGGMDGGRDASDDDGGREDGGRDDSGMDARVPGRCLYDGVQYNDGAEWYDGCNWCECAASVVSCTARACDVDAGDDESCTVGIVTFPNGTSRVPDLHSCNTCTCGGGRLLVCTEANCPLPACHVLNDLELRVPDGQRVPIPMYQLARDGRFTPASDLINPVCPSTLPSCGSDTIDADEINAALQHPDVVAAVMEEQSRFGDPSLNLWETIGIHINGRSIDVPIQCAAPCDVPAGILALRDLMVALVAQQQCEPTGAGI